MHAAGPIAIASIQVASTIQFTEASQEGGITTNLTLRNHEGYVPDVPKYHNAGTWGTD